MYKNKYDEEMNFIFREKVKISTCLQRYFNKVESDELLSANTISKYREVSSMLVAILNDMDVKKIDGFTIIDLKQKLNMRKLSASRKNHYLIVLRNLLKYLTEDEQMKLFDYNTIKKFKVPSKEIKFLSKDLYS